MSTRPRTTSLRSVALPVEHGGWGLTLEPAVLGVLLAPSLAGVLLGTAALLAFLRARPLRFLLRRSRAPMAAAGERVRLARRVAVLELVAMGVALLGAFTLAQDASWMWPLVIAGPMFAMALWFDLRSASRQLMPEVVGSLAVAAVAPMATLAGGGAVTLAVGAWLILGARVVSSIPHVRAQVQRIHGRQAPSGPRAHRRPGRGRDGCGSGLPRAERCCWVGSRSSGWCHTAHHAGSATAAGEGGGRAPDDARLQGRRLHGRGGVAGLAWRHRAPCAAICHNARGRPPEGPASLSVWWRVKRAAQR